MDELENNVKKDNTKRLKIRCRKIVKELDLNFINENGRILSIVCTLKNHR
ncbi:MAG: hypothetical protein CM15mP87_01330 [Candidatus Neomarinimicrobiota bacterium]|nr:MAG: hypothetical protein CM15mP87_01330 [Candidatus Neomarinimicrobiota bacterium]